MLDPTTGRPAAAPDTPERAPAAPEAAAGPRSPEFAPSGADGAGVPLAPAEAEDRRHQTGALFAQGARGPLTASG